MATFFLKSYTMLVPAMSLPEIKKSVYNDYQPEVKNREEIIKTVYKAKWIRNGRKDFAETVTFPVKSRNNWRITIICNKGNVTTIPYLISHDKVGITASYLLADSPEMPLMHFNSHFFKRFRERGKIDMDKPEQVINFFFRKNLVLIPCYCPRENGTQQLFVPVHGGVGLGNYHEDTQVCEFKTFVDNSLLRQDQREAVAQIWTDTANEMIAEIQRRMDKKKKLHVVIG
jgi:hypothetical protein